MFSTLRVLGPSAHVAGVMFKEVVSMIPSTKKSSSEKVHLIHKVMAWINIILVVLIVLFGIYLKFSNDSQSDSWSGAFILATFLLFVAIIHLLTAKGIKKGKISARVVSFVIGFLILFYFLIGTFFGALLMYFTTAGWEREQIKIND
jgi:hypothetical protein